MKSGEIFKFDPKNNQHIEQKRTYWTMFDGTVSITVPLKISRPVSVITLEQESAIRKSCRQKGWEYPSTQPHLTYEPRINTETGGTLGKGIQLYRHWFQYLKLALELESMGKRVILVRKQALINKITNNKQAYGKYKLVPQKFQGQGVLSRARVFVGVRVSRTKYKGWDLDEVLSNTFYKWWETHSHLFEGYAPTFLKSKNEWIDDPKFLYLRIDASSKTKDVHHFLTKELRKRLNDKGNPDYQIDGTPRSAQLQNRYNALILTLQGMSNKDICQHEPIYLRATDERSGSDGRLTVPIYGKKNLYSQLVSVQRTEGIHHLVDVMKGRFGSAPPKH